MAGLAVAASASFAEKAETLYGIGEPFGGWFANKGVEIEKVSDGVFKYEGHLEGYFGFTAQLGENDNDWDTMNAHRYAPKGNGTLTAGTSEMNYGADNSWNAIAGDYTLTIDTNTMTLTVAEQGEIEKVITWGIHGDITGNPNWETIMLTEGENNTWSAVINVTAKGNFGVKQMTNGSQTGWYNATEAFTYNAENTTTTLSAEGSSNLGFDYPVPGEYKFVFNTETNVLTVTPDGEAGIAAIDADNAVAKYFNLQGVEVANPENGLFIVVKGGKSSKVLVK